jgi:S1-C subfamily serine protease
MLRAHRALLPVVLLLASPRAATGAAVADRAAEATPPCVGRYADALLLSAAARLRESRPAAEWVHCLRSTAVYEQVSYGRGGKLRRQYVTKVRHGTGFAYRQDGKRWLVATNHHVVEFPEVTGEGGDVEGVPPGSRRVREEVRIVANESAPDDPEQIVLATVVEDDRLDVAVLASPRPLELLPYRLGRSADVQVGNAVLVRGFPLGAFAAANTGRVIAVGQRDLERGWDHQDFAVDALLNLGSSGSPVLAVSCQTGEPEVIGIYHAGYRGAQGLNVVIGMDEVRGLLETLQAPLRPVAPRERGLDPEEARAALVRGPLVIPFGGRIVRVAREGGAVRFAVLDPAFPLVDRVELSILDRGPVPKGRAAELRDALWDQLGVVLRYRDVLDGREGSRSRTVMERLQARLREGEVDQEDLLAAVRAGADGFAGLTRREPDPAARTPAESGSRPARVELELVLGQD